MAKTMTPSVSGMTDGQVEKAVEIFRAALRKHAAELSGDGAQIVLGQPGLGPAWLGEFRRRVEAISGLIVRHVRVDRSRIPRVAIAATMRREFTDCEVVSAMPRGEGDKEVDVYFFNLDRFVSDSHLEKEYEVRGLAPADPYSTAAVNEDDPEFGDRHPNATHWKDAEGRWCFAAFSRWRGVRDVSVRRYVSGWDVCWCFAGVRRPGA